MLPAFGAALLRSRRRIRCNRRHPASACDGSFLTRRWREMDSNFRFRARDKASVPRFRFGCLRGSPQTAAADNRAMAACSQAGDYRLRPPLHGTRPFPSSGESGELPYCAAGSSDLVCEAIGSGEAPRLSILWIDGQKGQGCWKRPAQALLRLCCCADLISADGRRGKKNALPCGDRSAGALIRVSSRPPRCVHAIRA